MAAPFPASLQKCSDSEQPWTVFSMKMGKQEEPKDKQISSHCINFTAIYRFMEMKTSPRTAISVDHRHGHVVINAERIYLVHE